MNTATPVETALLLRTVANQLGRARRVPLAAHLTLDISAYLTTLDEAERVAAVDAVASALGIVAGPVRVASYWEYRATRDDGGLHLVVVTEISGPRLCACGAACTHEAA